MAVQSTSAAVAGVIVACFALASSGAAQTPAPTNEDCQVCHNDASTTRANGAPVVVPTARFAASVHAQLACVDCHIDLAKTTEFPHADRLARVDCGSCHDEPAKRLASSVHAQAPARTGEAIVCVDCHGPPHDLRASSEPESRTYKLRIATTCGQCHGTPTGNVAKPGPQVAAAFSDSIHGRALSKGGLMVAPTCSDCHRSHDILTKATEASPLHPSNIPGTCGKCHAGVEAQYRRSVHHAALARGDAMAPQCASCHSAHAITRADGDAYRLSAAQQCGMCHTRLTEAFTRTFHGKATLLGSTSVAVCATCHGAHDILKASDPGSKVSPAHLVETCGACHQGANERFVQYDPHPNPDDYRRSATLWWVNRFYWTAIPGCFGFFGLHSALWFWRSWRDRQRGPPSGGGRRR